MTWWLIIFALILVGLIAYRHDLQREQEERMGMRARMDYGRVSFENLRVK